MNALSHIPAKLLSLEDLEDLLIYLCRFGEPRLSKHSDGWYCSCEMHVASEGATFKVASSFKEPTPLQAVQTCHARIKETLSKFGVTA